MVSSSSLFAPAIGMTIVEFLHGVYLGAQGRAPKHFIALTFFCAHYWKPMLTLSLIKTSEPATVYIHGHRTLKAPHPVRSAQLTRVPPS
jgi:hypothetical protein